MKETKIARITFVVTLSLAALVLLCGIAAAQSPNPGSDRRTQRRHHDGQDAGRRAMWSSCFRTARR